MGKHASKLLSFKREKKEDTTSKPKDNTKTKTQPPPEETNDKVCFEVLSESKKVSLTIKNAGGVIRSADFTKTKSFRLNNVYSFETKSGSGIGVPSKWKLTLMANPDVIDQSTLLLCLFMFRYSLDSSASLDAVVPIHAVAEGTIRLVCNDLLRSKKKADAELRKTFSNIPTEMQSSRGNLYKEENASVVCIGGIRWNLETILAVSPSCCMDLILEVHIFLNRTDQSPLSLVRNPRKKVSKSKTKLLKMGKLLLEGSKD